LIGRILRLRDRAPDTILVQWISRRNAHRATKIVAGWCVDRDIP